MFCAIKNILRTTLLSGISLLVNISVFSQPTITGPTCVVSGVIYQYAISGTWDSTSTMHVCLSGGVIADSLATDTCTPSGAPVYSVLVIWNNGSSASLALSSSTGNNSLSVSITTPLSPGSIDSASVSQIIGYDSIPQIINATLDTGGSCSPSYADQWQQSTDMLSWTDISGATGQNLNFSSPLIQTTFFRRKVVETTSGSIGYSNAATVSVLPLMPQTDSSSGSSDSLANNNSINNRKGDKKMRTENNVGNQNDLIVGEWNVAYIGKPKKMNLYLKKINC